MKIKSTHYIVLSICIVINFTFIDNLFAQNISYPPLRKATKISTIPNVWHSLITQLAKDGLYGTDIDIAFLQLKNVPSQTPMGNKIHELYSNKFIPKPKIDKNKKPVQNVYKNVVNYASVQKCQNFLNANKQAFDFIENKYQVPREIAVALLYVETRLGTWLGKDLAFLSLASMAQSKKINYISNWLPKLPNYKNNITWINQTMVKRADWAYTELYALLKYCRENNINPAKIPGSVYGAIGICQFMPSNIAIYGADGNGDGIINLFVNADAIASLANYLYKHGWRKSISRQKQHKVLKTYNRINIYANTILALNDAILAQNNLKVKINR